jgi:hypothetical protein
LSYKFEFANGKINQQVPSTSSFLLEASWVPESKEDTNSAMDCIIL